MKGSADGDDSNDEDADELYFRSTKLHTRMMQAVVRVNIRMNVKGRIFERSAAAGF